MVTIVLAIHVIVCISLVVVILLQQGKGAEIGAVFGGSSQTVFGASGAGNVLTRVTAALAVVFFATSMYLAYTSTQHATGSIFGSGSSVMHEHAPVSTKPVIPAPAPHSAPAPAGPAKAPAK